MAINRVAQQDVFFDRHVSGYAVHVFRRGAHATRGQISKIVYLSITNPPRACSPY